MTGLTILGGSSPFTIGLIDALKPVLDSLPRYDFLLHGRNRQHLQLIARYATTHLSDSGWNIRLSVDMSEALRGAAIVIHQIRYGDMEQRITGETFCHDWGQIADETLGPAALLTAMASVAPLRRTCIALRRFAPDALVLNLTNPLSAITALMHRFGVRNCVGICELPLVTAEETAAVLQVPLRRLQWQYTGLNHRGFIHGIAIDGVDQWDLLIERLDGKTIGGIGAEPMSQLRAIPTKYFRHVLGAQRLPSSSPRGLFLKKLRRRIVAELRRSTDESPASLKERYLQWYPRSLVPMLQAVNCDDPAPQIVNIIGADGLVWEGRANVSRDGIQFIESAPAPPAVKKWLDIFGRHERAFISAVEQPSLSRIQDVVSCDPTIQYDNDGLAAAIHHQYKSMSRNSDASSNYEH